MRVKIYSFLLILVFSSVILFSGSKANQQNEPTLNYVDHGPIVIENDSELAATSSSGSGTVIDPYIIEGYSFTTENTTGINVTGTTAFFEIRDCYFSTGRIEGVGIFVNVGESTCNITNTIFTNCNMGLVTNVGVRVIDSNSFSSLYNGIKIGETYEESINRMDGAIPVSIINNNFSDCNKGIYFDATLHHSVITENNFIDCSYGAFLILPLYMEFTNNVLVGCTRGSSIGGKNNRIVNNQFSSLTGDLSISCDYSLVKLNSFSAIVSIFTADEVSILDNYFLDGLKVSESDDLIISSNLFYQSSDFGLSLTGIYSGVTTCSIHHNVFQENTGYGISLESWASNNEIYLNEFIDNNNGNVQAKDNGSSNTWYNASTGIGNRWSDYDGSGTYLIDGSANSVDLYPEAIVIVNEFNTNYFFVFPVIIGLVVIPIFKNKRKFN